MFRDSEGMVGKIRPPHRPKSKVLRRTGGAPVDIEHFNRIRFHILKNARFSGRGTLLIRHFFTNAIYSSVFPLLPSETVPATSVSVN